jgi:putative effector of murein hydrolase
MQGSGSKPSTQSPPKSSEPTKFTPPFSAALEKILSAAVIGSGALAYFHPGKLTHVFYAIATIYSYVFATRIPRFLPPLVIRFLHPLLIAFSWAIAIFGLFGAARGQGLFPTLKEYLVPGGPMSAAGNHVLFWLEPSIITFAFSLYARRKLLFENALPILGGAISSTLIGIFSMALLGRVLGASRPVKLALLPRATAALAVVQAGMIGANAPLTAVNCCYMGIFCANFGVMMLNGLGIVDPIARGVATGCGGLALASAALSTLDPPAFPFGALGMSLTSSFATVCFCVPQFTAAVKFVAGL